MAETEARLRLLTDDSTDLITRHDPSGLITYVSPSCQSILGLDPDELLGRSAYDLIHPDDVAEVAVAHDELLGPTGDLRITFRARAANDRVVWLEAVARTIRDPRTHEVIEIHSVSRDVTERRELLRELEKVNEELRLADQVKSDFVAIASHELRRPLTSIAGFADLLVTHWDSLPDADRRTYAVRIDRQARRVNRLVDVLLTLSQLDAGGIEPHPSDVSVRAAICEAVEELEDSPDFAVACDPNLVAHVDLDHLHEILTNYLTNAMKYGAAPFAVDVSTVDAGIEIRVRDHGPGVPPDFVSHLFERFTRAASASVGEQGAGLGLAIVDGLIRVNGGVAFYEPNPDGGSCFTVRLPGATLAPPGS